MALPDCTCITGLPIGEQLSAIYCAARAWTDSDSLPSCLCVTGLPLSEQLTAIYEAVYAAAEDGDLRSVGCVRGLPLGEQLTAIYEAILPLTDSAVLPSALCVSAMPLFTKLEAIFCAAMEVELVCTVPTLLSATIVGSNLTLVFDRDVDGHDGFTIDVDGANDPLTYSSGDGTDTLTFSAETDAAEGDEVFLNYAPGDVQSGPECPLAGFTNFEVTNNTGLQFYYLRPDGVSRYLRPDGVSYYIRP